MPSLLRREDKEWAGRALAEPVPDRPFWDLLAASRAVGIADAWHASWVDFGIADLPLVTVEERLDRFVARALAEL